jgi:hypothetical protein
VRKVGKLLIVFFTIFSAEAIFAQNNSVTENLIHLGTRFGGSLYPYEFSDNSGSFNAAIQFSVQPIRLFTIQTELIYSKEHLDYSEKAYIKGVGFNYNAEIAASVDMNILTIPILVRLTYKPNNFYAIGLFGMYYSIPLGKMEFDVKIKNLDNNQSISVSESIKIKTSPGFMSGGIFGMKLGPGNLFADIRYSMDINDIKIEFEQKIMPGVNRKIIHFSIGYEFGFIK